MSLGVLFCSYQEFKELTLKNTFETCPRKRLQNKLIYNGFQFHQKFTENCFGLAYRFIK